MTALMDGHIRLDERGVAYVGATRLKLIHLAMTYRSEGDSVARVLEEYDWIAPADLFGAITYYLDHRQAVDGEIADYHEASERMRAAAGESDLAHRLKALRGS